MVGQCVCWNVKQLEGGRALAMSWSQSQILCLRLLQSIPSALPFPPQSLYVASSCQLRRLESDRHSAVCSHLAESFQGGTVVRAFGEQKAFVALSDARMDESQRVSFPRLVADR